MHSGNLGMRYTEEGDPNLVGESPRPASAPAARSEAPTGLAGISEASASEAARPRTDSGGRSLVSENESEKTAAATTYISTRVSMLSSKSRTWERNTEGQGAPAGASPEGRDGLCLAAAARAVRNPWFERVVALVIMLNAVYIGVATDYMAIHNLEKAPTVFQVIEMVFLLLFVTELGLRLSVQRTRLLRRRLADGSLNMNFYWNILDVLVISLQFVEILATYAKLTVNGFTQFTVLRVLRLVRLVRLVRIVKLFRFVRDLRMILFSIWRSLSIFFWAITALVLLIFMTSVYMTEMVLTRKLTGVADSQGLEDRFGSLTKTMMSLFQAVAGGVDWKDLTDVLGEGEGANFVVGPFLVYLAFTLFAMVNVITGVFLETAMESAREEKEIYVMRNARLVFSAVDHNRNGTITWPDFEQALDHPHMQNFFEAIDIHVSEAKALFDLLDVSSDGTVSADEFLNGCLRVRGPSKALDLLVLSHEVAQLFEKHSAATGGAPSPITSPSGSQERLRIAASEAAPGPRQQGLPGVSRRSRKEDQTLPGECSPEGPS